MTEQKVNLELIKNGKELFINFFKSEISKQIPKELIRVINHDVNDKEQVVCMNELVNEGIAERTEDPTVFHVSQEFYMEQNTRLSERVFSTGEPLLFDTLSESYAEDFKSKSLELIRNRVYEEIEMYGYLQLEGKSNLKLLNSVDASQFVYLGKIFDLVDPLNPIVLKEEIKEHTEWIKERHQAATEHIKGLHSGLFLNINYAGKFQVCYSRNLDDKTTAISRYSIYISSNTSDWSKYDEKILKSISFQEFMTKSINKKEA